MFLVLISGQNRTSQPQMISNQKTFDFAEMTPSGPQAGKSPAEAYAPPIERNGAGNVSKATQWLSFFPRSAQATVWYG